MLFELEPFESNEEDDIYFKLHCLYNAATELYDRKLTDLRSPLDPTEAFIIYGNCRHLSNANAIKTYNKCVTYITMVENDVFSYKKWKDCVRRYYNLSAQGWIDLCNNLIKSKKISISMAEYVSDSLRE